MSGRGFDAATVAALDRVELSWRHKALPVGAAGLRIDAVLGSGLTVADLPTPLLTLDAAALRHNARTMAEWCRARGVLLAPHGKTTMAPQLWAEQLRAGAWGITVANWAQLRVARAFGFSPLLLANSLTDPRAVIWAAGQVDCRIVSWVDSVQTVDLIQQALSAAEDLPPLDVLIEVGAVGGRTGARGPDAAVEVARAAAAADRVRVVGVAGYEGAVAHSASADDLARVRSFLADVGATNEALTAAGLYADADLMLSVGGSAYVDTVVDVLGPLTQARGVGGGRSVDLVLRSGAYLVHDDGFYAGISPSRRGDGPELRSAMAGWARVVSQPEPGLAILDGGKRDFPYDEGLPRPRSISRRMGGPATPVSGAEIVAIADQHTFLRFDPAATPVQIGDVVRLGLSHPCTAMDKWTLVPVLADVEADPTIIGFVHTFF